MTRELSFAERGLWFVHNAGSPGSCNVSAAVSIRAPLDVGRLLAAFEMVVARHDALRTSYELVDGELRAHARADVAVETSVENVAGQSTEELDALVLREHERPFDLTSPPLCRMKVWTREREDHVLLLTMHHAAVDWTAMSVCAEEMLEFYAAGLHSDVLPQLAGGYDEFVTEQRAMLAAPEADQAWRYWSELLPEKRPDPPLAATRGERGDSEQPRLLPFTLEREARRRIERFAWANRVPPNVALLSLWVLALRREGASQQLILGLPRSLRRRRFASTVGCFTNTVPLVVDGDASAPAGELTTGLREQLRESIPHQFYPLELLAQRLPDLSATPGRPPIYDVTFNYVPTDGNNFIPMVSGASDITAEMGSLRVSPFRQPPSIGPIGDFTLHLTELPGKFVGTIAYNDALFEPATALNIRGHLLALSEEI